MNLQIFTLYITYSHISTISRNPVPTSPKSAASSLIMFYRLQQLKAIRIQVLQRLSRDMGHEPPEVLGTEAEALAVVSGSPDTSLRPFHWRTPPRAASHCRNTLATGTGHAGHGFTMFHHLQTEAGPFGALTRDALVGASWWV